MWCLVRRVCCLRMVAMLSGSILVGCVCIAGDSAGAVAGGLRCC